MKSNIPTQPMLPTSSIIQASTLPQPLAPPTPEKPKKANALLILGLLEIIIPGIILFFVIPNLIILQFNLQLISFNTILLLFIFGLIVIVDIAQITVGVISYKKSINSKIENTLMFLGFLMAAITIPSLFLMVHFIYKFIDTI